MQDNQDKETSTDKVQTKREYKKKESVWGRDFPHPSRRVLEPTHPPVRWHSVLFLGGKAAGAWR